ncbi:MAG: copper resistance protein CopC [Anaerolineae bacterium]|nr:copper resistance protein CopC [Anaerolineae bacterium]
MKPQWLTAVVLTILMLVNLTPAVQAHANLVRSDPADGANLSESPPEIHLWFDEAISSQFSTAQLLDVNSQPVEGVGIRADSTDPKLLILTLPELPPGVYSVLWKVLSETDGHFSQGLLVFGVGAEVDSEAAGIAVTKTEAPPLPEVMLRWFNFSTLSGLVGAIAMVYLVLAPIGYGVRSKPAEATIRHAAQRRILGWASWCVGLALLVGLELLVWQTATLQETLPTGVSFWSVGWQILSGTRWGILWLVRQSILLLLSVLLFWLYRTACKPARPEPRGIASPLLPNASVLFISLLLLALVIVQALTSHASALTPNTTLALIVDAVHLLAASLWVGGLLALAVGLLPLLRRRKGRADLITLVKIGWRPFSRIAVLSVGLLVATGLYSTGRQIASVDALITTLYGQALLGKITLMLLVGVLGLLNSMLIHPQVAAPLAWLLRRPAGWTPLPLRRLPTVILAEVGLGLLVFLAAGLLTAAPSPRGPEYTVNAEEVPTALSRTVDNVVVTMLVKPNRPGQNIFTVFAADRRRPAPAEILRVIVRFTFLGQDMGRVSATAEEVEPGRYMVGGNYLSLAGPWQIDVVVRRKGIEDSVAHFNWLVAPPGGSRPVLISNYRLEPVLTIAAAIIILLLLLGVIGVLIGRNYPFAQAWVRQTRDTKYKERFQHENESILGVEIDSNRPPVLEYSPHWLRRDKSAAPVRNDYEL